MPQTNIDKLGEQYLKFAKVSIAGTIVFEQQVAHYRFRLKAFNANGKVMTNETGWHYYTEVPDTVVLELAAINLVPDRPEETFVFTLGKDGRWCADYPYRYRTDGISWVWAQTFSALLVAFEQYLIALAAQNVSDERKEQEAINNAFATSLDFTSVTEMLCAVPVDKRLPSATSYQDHVNHAMAFHKGYDSMDAMLSAAKTR